MIGRELYTDRLFQQIHGPLTRLDQMLAQLQAGQGNAGKLLISPEQYEQLRASLAQLRGTLTDLQKQPMLNSDQAYQDWNRVLGNLIQQVDAFNATPLLITPSSYENLNGAVKELQEGLKEFREHPSKFLRLKLF